MFCLTAVGEQTPVHQTAAAHHASYITKIGTRSLPVIWPYQFEPPHNEGLALQYCIEPAGYDSHQVTVRMVTAAPDRVRAQLRATLVADLFPKSACKDYRHIADGLREFNLRHPHQRYKTILTTDELANSLPLAPTLAPHPLLDELVGVVRGEVLADEASLNHYATDGSVFAVKPWAAVLPVDVLDIQNLVRWASAKKSEIRDPKSEITETLSITCRGAGTDQAGGPLNSGIILNLSHLNRIKEISKEYIVVEPGVFWSTINEALAARGRFVPSYPSSASFSTIGGGVANNCAGEKTVKYGSVREYVQSVKIIDADGEEIELRRLSEWEIERKQSQTDREGEIYRQLYDLLIANHNLIENSRLQTNKISTGYWLADALGNQTLNLASIICGAQGTLGVITEITLKTIPKPQHTGLLVTTFENLEKAGGAVLDLLQLRPSALEMVDGLLINWVRQRDPGLLARLFDDNKNLTAVLQREQSISPAIMLLIEFDGDDPVAIQTNINHAKDKLRNAAVDLREALDSQTQAELWKIRHSAALVAEQVAGNKKALPFIEDVTVHPRHLASFLTTLYRILQKHQVTFSVWGHAGNGNVHVQPLLDLSNDDDRVKIPVIAEAVYAAAIKLRGAISGEHNDGIMRTPYLQEQFGKPMFELFKKVKNIFDPQNIFNPGKKIGIDREFLRAHLRHEYSGEGHKISS